MEEQIISFETAKLAKEKGFDAYCNCWYFIGNKDQIEEYPKYYREKCLKNYQEIDRQLIYKAIGGQHGKTINQKFNNEIDLLNVIAAPTQSLLQKWLREEHNIYIEVNIKNVNSVQKFFFSISHENNLLEGYSNVLDIWLGLDYSKQINTEHNICNAYEDALEQGLLESLNLIK